MCYYIYIISKGSRRNEKKEFLTKTSELQNKSVLMTCPLGFAGADYPAMSFIFVRWHNKNPNAKKICANDLPTGVCGHHRTNCTNGGGAWERLCRGKFFFRFLDFSPFNIVLIFSHIFLSQEESTSKHLLLDDRSEWRRIISTIINIAPRDAYNNIRLDTNTQTHKFQGMYITSYDMTQIKIWDQRSDQDHAWSKQIPQMKFQTPRQTSPGYEIQ